MTRVLIVEDEPEFSEMVGAWLRTADHDVDCCESGEAALSMLGANHFDLVLADLNLQGEMNGLELCQRIAGASPDVPVIVMTAFGNMDTAISAIRVGAYDFVPKPVDKRHLLIAAGRAIGHSTLKEEVKRLQTRLERTSSFEELIGESPSMQRVYELIDLVSDVDSTVLITGESGTGKELVARALHARSRRKAAPFVPINCAAMPAALLESELFGHEKGAFTDAKAAKKGLFAEAEGGTIFLDEIGEMPLEMQAKLLRALQERNFRRVGGTELISFDARLITATHRDLADDVEQGRFREDLYYRVNVIEIPLPPLRSRGNDVLLLAQSFLRKAACKIGKEVVGISREAANRMVEYNWPGNVRELENCIEAAVTLTRFDHVMVEDLPEKIRRYRPQDFIVQTTNPAELPTLKEMERRYVLKVLNAVEGNKSAAAKILGFDRRTLYRKLEAFGSDTPE